MLGADDVPFMAPMGTKYGAVKREGCTVVHVELFVCVP